MLSNLCLVSLYSGRCCSSKASVDHFECPSPTWIIEGAYNNNSVWARGYQILEWTPLHCEERGGKGGIYKCNDYNASWLGLSNLFVCNVENYKKAHWKEEFHCIPSILAMYNLIMFQPFSWVVDLYCTDTIDWGLMTSALTSTGLLGLKLKHGSSGKDIPNLHNLQVQLAIVTTTM